MNAMAASASYSSSSPSSSSSVWIAALVGAAAAAGLWIRHGGSIGNGNVSGSGSSHNNRGGDGSSSSPRRRKSSGGGGNGSSPDEAASSESISVEGSVMVTLPTWAIESLNSDSDNDTNNNNNNNNNNGGGGGGNNRIGFARHYYTDEEMMSIAIRLSDRNITEGTGGPFGAAIFERHPPSLPIHPPGGYCTLVSVGVNRVVSLGNSTLHAEMVAIQLAQRRVGSYTLSRVDADGGVMRNDGSGDHGEADGLFYDESREEEEEEENIPPPSSSSGADICINATTGGEGRKKRRFELFTSCEPCAMCLGATLWSGVSRMVCGASKTDAEAIGFDEGPVFPASYDHLREAGVCVERNVLGEEAASVLRRYGQSSVIYNR